VNPSKSASPFTALPPGPTARAQSARRSLAARLSRLPLLAAVFVSIVLAEPAWDLDTELLNQLSETVSRSDSFQDRFDAEVWLLAQSTKLEKFIAEKRDRLEFLRKVHRAASLAGLQPEVVLAVIEIESRFDPYAISSAGAQGLMQVMPFWKNEIGRPDDNLINPEVNLRYGCTILKYYLDKEEGRLADALARYNGSYGQYWYPERVLIAWEKRWR